MRGGLLRRRSLRLLKVFASQFPRLLLRFLPAPTKRFQPPRPAGLPGCGTAIPDMLHSPRDISTRLSYSGPNPPVPAPGGEKRYEHKRCPRNFPSASGRLRRLPQQPAVPRAQDEEPTDGRAHPLGGGDE